MAVRGDGPPLAHLVVRDGVEYAYRRQRGRHRRWVYRLVEEKYIGGQTECC